MKTAVTRKVSRSIGECELTFLQREAIDLDRARQQHAHYEAALKEAGCHVISLPEEPGLPDAVFVEDTAIVLDECAIILRPGAKSRLPETDSITRALAPYRDLLHMEGPATIDGGDILRLGRRLYVGISSRSSSAAVEQLTTLTRPWGYEVRAIEVTGCLHLKSAITEVGDGVVVVNPDWVDVDRFDGVSAIKVDPSESHAANALRLGETLLCAQAFPRTIERLRRAGLQPRPIEADELAKAEGGLTCCSLLFEG